MIFGFVLWFELKPKKRETVLVVLLAKERQNLVEDGRGRANGLVARKGTGPGNQWGTRWLPMATRRIWLALLSLPFRYLKSYSLFSDQYVTSAYFTVRNLFSLRRVYLCCLSPITWKKMARKWMSTKVVRKATFRTFHLIEIARLDHVQ